MGNYIASTVGGASESNTMRIRYDRPLESTEYRLFNATECRVTLPEPEKVNLLEKLLQALSREQGMRLDYDTARHTRGAQKNIQRNLQNRIQPHTFGVRWYRSPHHIGQA